MVDRIVRSWGATADAAGASVYERHFTDHVLPLLAKVPGHLGASLLRQDEADGTVNLLVLTSWESMDSVRAFAGEKLETAVVAEAAAKVLIDYDRRVKHYRIAAEAVV